ncbi:MAG: GGDEF domain-containing protein [Clostridia bacterium]|nr:GGDEF domain-containing protein [Clostridia bacterium]
MKKLLLLQTIGIILFVIGTVWLDAVNAFTPTTQIILYTVLGVGNVINAKTHLLKPIEELSIHDKLTGVYNRNKLDMVVPEYENYNEYAIIFFDVNNLKKMNDIHGHDDGDRLLLEASRQLRFWHRYGDLYRIGGDEFIVVLPNFKQSQVEKILAKWTPLLPPLNAEYEDDFVCDFSYGTFYKTAGDSSSFEEIMNRADEEMYKMKKERKVQRQ